MERSFQTLKKGGFLVTSVQPPSEDKAKEYGITAVMVEAQPSAKQLVEINGLIDEGKLKTHIATVLPLAEVKKRTNFQKADARAAK